MIVYDPHFVLPIKDLAHYTFENKEYIVVRNDESIGFAYFPMQVINVLIFLFYLFMRN